jgi:hypothetical protein
VAGQELNDDGDAHDALKSYAARGSEEAARAGLALAFAISEGFLDSPWSGGWTQARAHLEFLERHGYVLSEAERHELDQSTTEEDTEPEPGE